MRPQGVEAQQSITFVGCGHVTATLAGLIILKNREFALEVESAKTRLKELGEDNNTHETRELRRQIAHLESQIVKVSILGRSQNSADYQSMSRGIDIKINGTVEHILPSEYQIKTDSKDIGAQDHVVIATKTYSHNTSLINSVRHLRKSVPTSDRATTVTLAQNGVPSWFTLNKAGNPIPIDGIPCANEIIGAFKSDIVGCSLNLACTHYYDENGKKIFQVLTDPGQISAPLDRVFGPEQRNVTRLGEIFQNAGISTAVSTLGNIRFEVLKKLQVNVVNGICTLFNKTIGDILANEDLMAVFMVMASEVNAIAAKCGFPNLRTDKDLLERMQRSKEHYTTMHRDFAEGLPLEIDTIYKATDSLAQVNGLELNIIPKMYNVLQSLVAIRDHNIDRLRSTHLGTDYVQNTANRARDLLIPSDPSPTKEGSVDNSELDSEHDVTDAALQVQEILRVARRRYCGTTSKRYHASATSTQVPAASLQAPTPQPSYASHFPDVPPDRTSSSGSSSPTYSSSDDTKQFTRQPFKDFEEVKEQKYVIIRNIHCESEPLQKEEKEQEDRRVKRARDKSYLIKIKLTDRSIRNDVQSSFLSALREQFINDVRGDRDVINGAVTTSRTSLRFLSQDAFERFQRWTEEQGFKGNFSEQQPSTSATKARSANLAFSGAGISHF